MKVTLRRIEIKAHDAMDRRKIHVQALEGQGECAEVLIERMQILKWKKRIAILICVQRNENKNQCVRMMSIVSTCQTTQGRTQVEELGRKLIFPLLAMSLPTPSSSRASSLSVTIIFIITPLISCLSVQPTFAFQIQDSITFFNPYADIFPHWDRIFSSIILL